MSAGQLTREDFEALLWDYLSKQPPPTLEALGITVAQWLAFTPDVMPAWREALDAVHSDLARHVWDHHQWAKR